MCFVIYFIFTDCLLKLNLVKWQKYENTILNVTSEIVWPHFEGHCAVQINDCEAAVLGGVTNDTEFRDDILIFNFDDAKWKLGPR